MSFLLLFHFPLAFCDKTILVSLCHILLRLSELLLKEEKKLWDFHVSRVLQRNKTLSKLVYCLHPFLHQFCINWVFVRERLSKTSRRIWLCFFQTQLYFNVSFFLKLLRIFKFCIFSEFAFFQGSLLFEVRLFLKFASFQSSLLFKVRFFLKFACFKSSLLFRFRLFSEFASFQSSLFLEFASFQSSLLFKVCFFS